MPRRQTVRTRPILPGRRLAYIYAMPKPARTTPAPLDLFGDPALAPVPAAAVMGRPGRRGRNA